MARLARLAVLKFSVINRRRKAHLFKKMLESAGVEDLVLVGATGLSDQENEAIVENLLTAHFQIRAACNVHPTITSWPFVVGDGRQLPFADDAVGAVLSNAVIEHVGNEVDQLAFMREHARVGRFWIVTTPNRWFPVESHTAVLLLHWRRRWRAEQGEVFTRLLSRREFERLLPSGSKIIGRWWSPTFTAYPLLPGSDRIDIRPLSALAQKLFILGETHLRATLRHLWREMSSVSGAWRERRRSPQGH